MRTYLAGWLLAERIIEARKKPRLVYECIVDAFMAGCAGLFIYICSLL